MDSTRRIRLLQLAANQHGLVERRQALECGYTREAWLHLAASKEWTLTTRRVARRLGAPVTHEQRVLAAVLDLGPSTYASHETAAELWDLPGFRSQTLEVIVLRGGRETSSSLARVHRPRHLPDPFAATLDGVPVVRPALLLLQLASRVSPARLHRLLDNLWNRRLVSAPSIRHELRTVMHRGRPGTRALRELLDRLPSDYVPPASGLESRFTQILSAAGIDTMRRQIEVGSEQWCGRVDFIDADLPLAVEVDSERYHSALSDIAADQVRQARIERAGFTVVRFTDFQIWHRAHEVVAELSEVRARMRATLSRTGWDL